MTGPERVVRNALLRDPPIDAVAPAQTLPHAIPSCGCNLNALLYTAAGAGPHPTVLLLHGLPGNEQNIDLAQSIRRLGWNVLTVHYRGSWGGPGAFRFEHCLEDAAAALDWLRTRDPSSRVDVRRIVVIGHSMGGFVATHVFAGNPDLIGAALISGVDVGRSFGTPAPDRAVARVDDNIGASAGLHILAETTSASLADEARACAGEWRLTNYAARLADRSLLVITADDGYASDSHALADAIDGKALTGQHFATDHSYSDCRIALQTEVLRWLVEIAATRPS